MNTRKGEGRGCDLVNGSLLQANLLTYLYMYITRCAKEKKKPYPEQKYPEQEHNVSYSTRNE